MYSKIVPLKVCDVFSVRPRKQNSTFLNASKNTVNKKLYKKISHYNNFVFRSTGFFNHKDVNKVFFHVLGYFKNKI